MVVSSLSTWGSSTPPSHLFTPVGYAGAVSTLPAVTEETSLPAPTNPQKRILHRLRRLEGQVCGLSRMVEEERDCLDILTLLAGIRSALDAAGEALLEGYVERCQREGVLEGEALRRMIKLLR